MSTELAEAAGAGAGAGATLRLVRGGAQTPVTVAEVFTAFREANRELGVTVLVVTHDPLVSEQVGRTVAIRDGRTASEVLRRTVVDDAGEEQHVAEEFALLDRAGRLQLPRDFVTALDLRRRVRLALEPDHIQVHPDASDQRNGSRP